MPARFSLITAFTLSTLVCISIKRGLAFVRTTTIIRAVKGKETIKTAAKDELMVKDIIRAKTIINGALTAIRKLIMVTWPRVLQSLVSLVISEATENLSRFAKENP